MNVLGPCCCPEVADQHCFIQAVHRWYGYAPLNYRNLTNVTTATTLYKTMKVTVAMDWIYYDFDDDEWKPLGSGQVDYEVRCSTLYGDTDYFSATTYANGGVMTWQNAAGCGEPSLTQNSDYWGTPRAVGTIGPPPILTYAYSERNLDDITTTPIPTQDSVADLDVPLDFNTMAANGVITVTSVGATSLVLDYEIAANPAAETPGAVLAAATWTFSLEDAHTFSAAEAEFVAMMGELLLRKRNRSVAMALTDEPLPWQAEMANRYFGPNWDDPNFDTNRLVLEYVRCVNRYNIQWDYDPDLADWVYSCAAVEQDTWDAPRARYLEPITPAEYLNVLEVLPHTSHVCATKASLATNEFSPNVEWQAGDNTGTDGDMVNHLLTRFGTATPDNPPLSSGGCSNAPCIEGHGFPFTSTVYTAATFYGKKSLVGRLAGSLPPPDQQDPMLAQRSFDPDTATYDDANATCVYDDNPAGIWKFYVTGTDDTADADATFTMDVYGDLIRVQWQYGSCGILSIDDRVGNEIPSTDPGPCGC